MWYKSVLQRFTLGWSISLFGDQQWIGSVYEQVPMRIIMGGACDAYHENTWFFTKVQCIQYNSYNWLHSNIIMLLCIGWYTCISVSMMAFACCPSTSWAALVYSWSASPHVTPGGVLHWATTVLVQHSGGSKPCGWLCLSSVHIQYIILLDLVWGVKLIYMYFTVSSECGGSKPDAVHDSTESGTRCESSIVNAPAVCTTESQIRTCSIGSWSAWSVKCFRDLLSDIEFNSVCLSPAQSSE